MNPKKGDVPVSGTSEQDWKFVEQVVAILEQHLDHDATVEHDVDLPVLNSPTGRIRQCDVVIRTGTKHRETISIVEVQARGTKPSIKDFGDWLTKLEEVGAQHLICVSQKGYPSSIVEKAKLMGPTIRLIDLNDEPEEARRHLVGIGAPPQVLNNVRYERLHRMMVEGVHVMKLDPDWDTSDYPDPHDQCFRIGEHEISASDLLDRHFFGSNEHADELPRGEPVVVHVTVVNETNIGAISFRSFGGKWVPLKGLALTIELIITETAIDWSSATYEQHSSGELGWILKGRATNTEGQPLDVVIPFRFEHDDWYSMGRPVTVGQSDMFFTLGEKTIRSQRLPERE